MEVFFIQLKKELQLTMTEWLHYPEQAPYPNQRVLLRDPYSKQEVEAIYVSRPCDRFREQPFIFEGTGRLKSTSWKPYYAHRTF